MTPGTRVGVARHASRRQPHAPDVRGPQGRAASRGSPGRVPCAGPGSREGRRPAATRCGTDARPGGRAAVARQGDLAAVWLAPLPGKQFPHPCRRRRDPPPPPPPDPITLVAGDIACRPALVDGDHLRHARTADLVESLAPDAVAVLGDNQYEHGGWRTSWPCSTRRGGASVRTHPAVGNHEYEGDPERDEAPGYYSYFGASAERPGELLPLAARRLERVRAQLGRDQLDARERGQSVAPRRLLAGVVRGRQRAGAVASNELAALPDDACVIAYWHHPRCSGFGA